MNPNASEAAADVRRIAFRLMADVGGGHYGGNLSEIEILTVLYRDVLHIKPEDPKWEGRDRFVMAKGHGGFGLYAALCYSGFVSYEELARGDGCGVMVSKHASTHVAGVEVSTGSLGQGLSIACGMALAMKADHKASRVYTLLGDGECNEGQVWEAAMLAGKYRLDNLAAVIDNNRLEFDGRTEDIMPVEPLRAKWEAFGWNVEEVDGHDVEQLRAAFQKAGQTPGRPTVIIAYTVKGKGISYMEDRVEWHAGAVTKEQFEIGMRELEA